MYHMPQVGVPRVVQLACLSAISSRNTTLCTIGPLLWVLVISSPGVPTMFFLEEGAGPREVATPESRRGKAHPGHPWSRLQEQRQINRNHRRFPSPEIPFSPLFSPSATILSFLDHSSSTAFSSD